VFMREQRTVTEKGRLDQRSMILTASSKCSAPAMQRWVAQQHLRRVAGPDRHRAGASPEAERLMSDRDHRSTRTSPSAW
jgi:hypothetical protein